MSIVRHPIVQLTLARLREFFREWEALFWVYGFPLGMTIVLGFAFRNQPPEPVAVDVAAGPGATTTAVALNAGGKLKATVREPAECVRRLRVGKTPLVVVPAGAGAELRYDPERPEARAARDLADDALQRAAGRRDVAPIADSARTEPGARYLDFLVPGLLGMGLMGGGLWGVGYAVVDLRIRKVLKRFLATPMARWHFLAAMLLSRLVFLAPEVFTLLAFARFAFDVRVQGSGWLTAGLILLGATMFAGIGLLIASRARTVEAINGLMNFVLLPMWVGSGIFFSTERYPDAAQPFIKALPLTALLDALRPVMQEGAGLADIWRPTLLMAAYAVGSFWLALRIFRWS